MMAKCSTCDGRGTVPCRPRVLCVTCGGTGRTTNGKGRCSACDGRGTVTCYECNGSGQVTCLTCRGSGLPNRGAARSDGRPGAAAGHPEATEAASMSAQEERLRRFDMSDNSAYPTCSPYADLDEHTQTTLVRVARGLPVSAAERSDVWWHDTSPGFLGRHGYWAHRKGDGELCSVAHNKYQSAVSCWRRRATGGSRQ